MTHYSRHPRSRFHSTIIHLSAKQEALHASLQALAEEKAAGIPTSRPPPVTIYTYPFVSASPPFPFEAGPPIDHASGKVSSIAPYLRSANNLSYTRTLALLRRELGPHFPFEKLWEKHTYFVSLCGDFLGTGVLSLFDRNLLREMRRVRAFLRLMNTGVLCRWLLTLITSVLQRPWQRW